MGELRITFGDSVVGANVEDLIADTLAESGNQLAGGKLSTVFDLSAAKFINPQAFQVLVAYIRTIERQGGTARITPPISRKVRYFMLDWGVEFATITGCNQSLATLCERGQWTPYTNVELEQSYERLEHFPNGQPRIFHPDSCVTQRISHNRVAFLGQIRPKNFMGFHCFDADKIENKTGVANQEKDWWLAGRVGDVVEEKIGINRRFMGPRVIYEALFNSLRHPDANVVQTAMFMSSNKGNAYEYDFFGLGVDRSASAGVQVHYWDDGKSMVDLFAEGVCDPEINPRTGNDQSFFSRYKVRYFDKNKQRDHFGKRPLEATEYIDSNHEISPDMPKWLQIVTMAFPHVSSAPTKPGHAVAPELEKEDKRYADIGMGLYLLIEASTKMFGGTVSIRSDQYACRFKRNKLKGRRKDTAKFGHDYDVDVYRLQDELPPFLGNLISISISRKEFEAIDKLRPDAKKGATTDA